MEQFLNEPIDADKSRAFFTALVNDLSKSFVPFRNPVVQDWPELAESYLRAVQQPMSFKEIRVLLRDSKAADVTRLEVLKMFALIGMNCRSFNPPDSDLFGLSQQYDSVWIGRAVKWLIEKGLTNIVHKDLIDYITSKMDVPLAVTTKLEQTKQPGPKRRQDRRAANAVTEAQLISLMSKVQDTALSRIVKALVSQYGTPRDEDVNNRVVELRFGEGSDACLAKFVEELNKVKIETIVEEESDEYSLDAAEPPRKRVPQKAEKSSAQEVQEDSSNEYILSDSS